MDEMALTGQIEIFPYAFAPRGWMKCEGQVLQISQYQPLYSVLGNQFGGKAPQTFALPDLTADQLEKDPPVCYYIYVESSPMR